MILVGFLTAFVVVAVAIPHPSKKIDADGCGQRPLSPGAPSAQPFVVGGDEVEPKFSFPWMCSLQTTSEWHFCGCSLIKSQQGEYFVMTAAHCVRPNSVTQHRAVVGAHNVQNTTEESRQTLTFSEMSIHPNYSSNTLENDITIFKLENQPVENDYVQPVCIPTSHYVGGEDSIVTGWGTTSFGGSSSDVLLEGRKPLVSDEACTAAYGSAFVPSSMMCSGFVGVGGVDACQGDSGGPLVVYQNNEWQEVGIVSWGYGCAQPNYPGVYADVYNLKEWIDGVIN